MQSGRAIALVCSLAAGAALCSAANAASEGQPRPASQQRAANAGITVAAMPAALRGAPTATARNAATRPAATARNVSLRPLSTANGTALRPVSVSGGISCVPYARMVTGMEISGDGRQWWHNAAGSYARGSAPERGSVLAFMGSGGMGRGHVAVVSQVVNDRTILIDHANWGGPGIRRGTVMRGVRVRDVSDRNDWTAVQVQVGWDSSNFGRTYPTYGFIYNRRPDGRILTASAAPVEVAQASSPHVAQHLRLAESLGN